MTQIWSVLDAGCITWIDQKEWTHKVPKIKKQIHAPYFVNDSFLEKVPKLPNTEFCPYNYPQSIYVIKDNLWGWKLESGSESQERFFSTARTISN